MFEGLDPINTLGMIMAFFFTVLVLLYAFGDNTFFRLAIHIFIGVAAGYAGAVALNDVLIPRLSNLEGTQNMVALGLIVLLAMKISPKTAVFGNPVSGLLVGAGAAIAIGGAIQGTILPQVSGASNFFNPELLKQAMGQSDYGQVFELVFGGGVVLVGTIATLIHFHFSVKYVPNQIPERNRFIRVFSWIGQGFIAVTFGVLFAGIYSAALAALVERFHFIVNFILNFMGLFG